MTQADIVVDILSLQVAELTKENAILKANCQLAQKELEEIKNDSRNQTDTK